MASTNAWRIRMPQPKGAPHIIEPLNEKEGTKRWKELQKKGKTLIDLEECVNGHWTLRRRWSPRSGEIL